MNQQANSQHYCLLQYFIEQIPPFGTRQVFGLVELNGVRHMIKSASINWIDESLAMAYTRDASFQLGELITDEKEKFIYRQVFLRQNIKNIFAAQISTKICQFLH